MSRTPHYPLSIQVRSGIRIRTFVDGENFRHVIRPLFPTNTGDYLPPQADWQSFYEDISYSALPEGFKEDWSGLEPVHWYVPGKIKASKKLALKMKSYSKKARKRFLKRQRQHQAITEKCPKIIFEKAGFVSLIHAGRSEEKGVDAALSADLIRYSYHFDIAVVVSGDADFLPVIQRLRSSGKRVVNVEYLKENGQILEGNASELMSQVDGTIRVPFDRMSQYMGYAKPIKKGTGRRLPEAIPG